MRREKKREKERERQREINTHTERDKDRDREPDFMFSAVRKIWENGLVYSEMHIHSQHTDYICN